MIKSASLVLLLIDLHNCTLSVKNTHTGGLGAIKQYTQNAFDLKNEAQYAQATDSQLVNSRKNVQNFSESNIIYNFTRNDLVAPKTRIDSSGEDTKDVYQSVVDYNKNTYRDYDTQNRGYVQVRINKAGIRSIRDKNKNNVNSSQAEITLKENFQESVDKFSTYKSYARNEGQKRFDYNRDKKAPHIRYDNTEESQLRGYYVNEKEQRIGYHVNAFPSALRVFNVTFSTLGKRKNASGVIVPLNNCHKLQNWTLVRKLTNWVALYTSSNPLSRNSCSHPIINAMAAIDNGASAVIFDAFDDQTNAKSLLKRQVDSAVNKSIIVVESREFRRIFDAAASEGLTCFVDIVDASIHQQIQFVQPEIPEDRQIENITAQDVHLKMLIVATAFIVIVSFSFLVILVTFKRFGDRCKSIYCRLKMNTLGKKGNYSRYDVEKIMEDSLDEQCSICLQDFQIEEIVRTLPCNHTFHQDCIDAWFFFKKSCPLCIYTIKDFKAKSVINGKSTKKKKVPTATLR